MNVERVERVSGNGEVSTVYGEPRGEAHEDGAALLHDVGRVLRINKIVSKTNSGKRDVEYPRSNLDKRRIHGTLYK